MAEVKFIFTCVFLLVLVFSHEIHSAEGRHLKSQKELNKNLISSTHLRNANKETGKISSTAALTTTTTTSELHSTTEYTHPVAVVHIDDVRPKVVPGHSTTLNQGNVEEDSAALAEGSGEISRPPSPGRVEDFRPTAPGHSPGVGHSIQN
ncbi:hypothetical protein BVC80_9065g99 [Macleaya cordata]|uniref:Encoded peptide n=1 Tax=Macleaya cordata TaxID=56857 RepID=A0A200PNN2_MACCD|nr:hypothetical protein BVC80_9065g99 [Macleaya cordata]